MARIEKYIIERILDTAKIEEVVGDFPDVELKKKGVRYLGLCPFHEDRHRGSFVVYPKGNCYKCFSCGAKGGVVDFLMKHERLSYPDAIRWLGKKYNIETDMTDFNYTPPPPRPKPEPLPMLVLPDAMVNARMKDIDDNILVRWIRMGINWDTIQRKRVDEMLTVYRIGHSPKNGMTIFWQIDEDQQVRTGKMMLYKMDGHRDKRDGAYTFDWIHSALFRDKRHPEYDEDKQEMKQTLFGMHLLDQWKRKDIEQTVCIVESEKTALLMAIAYGNHPKQVWMACGGLENLTRTRIQPLIDQRRNIIVYPDRDGVEKWRQKVEQLHYDRILVDDVPVTKWWQPCDGEKADIADVVVRIMNERKPMTNIGEVKAVMPVAAPLINKLNLKITDDE
jgi:hypothetical protein